MLLRKGSNNRRDAEEKEEAAAALGNTMSQEYHECVEEIKTEGQALGSLQLHNEAMRRLKQRRIANGITITGRHSVPAGGFRERRRRTGPKRVTLASSMRMENLAKSLKITELSKSINAMALGRINGNNNSRHNSDPSNVVMLGRRDSTCIGGFGGGGCDDYQGGLLPNNFRADIELSDSEDEDYDDEPQQTVSQLLGETSSSGGGGSGGRRSSMIRRRSSILSIMGEAGGGGGRRASVVGRRSSVKIPTLRRTNDGSRRASNASSVSFGTSDSGPSVTRKSSDGDVSEGNNRIDENVNNVNGTEEGREMPVNFGDKEESEPQLPTMPRPRRKRPQARTGRRNSSVTGRHRSSLCSVDERRASIIQGPDTSSNRSSICSIGNSLDGSLKGSFSSELKECFSNGGERSVIRDGSLVMREGSLICGFGRWDSMRGSLTSSLGSAKDNGSDDINDDLICSWERRQSALYDSMASIQPEDLLKEIEGENHCHLTRSSPVAFVKSNRSLICGWDPASSTMSQMSITEDELLHELEGGGNSIEEDDEKKNDFPSASEPYSFANSSNRSLICTWAKNQTAMMANSLQSIADELDVPVKLQEEDEEDEEILLKTKEGCNLFDVVRKGEVA